MTRKTLAHTPSKTSSAAAGVRPRRRAAARASAASAAALATDALATVVPPPTYPREPSPTEWSGVAGEALVGRLVSIIWEPTKEFYEALVVAYNKRRKQHTLIYLDDSEAVEVVELGAGPGQRAWRMGGAITDDLIGREVLLMPGDKKRPGDEDWFDFMRPPRHKNPQGLVVRPFLRMDELPDGEELASPVNPEAPQDDTLPHKYYRVICVPNEYLATIDLAHVPYRVLPNLREEREQKELQARREELRAQAAQQSKQSKQSQQHAADDEAVDLVSPVRPQRSALPASQRRVTQRSGSGDRDEDSEDDKVERDAYEPPKNAGVESEPDPSEGIEELGDNKSPKPIRAQKASSPEPDGQESPTARGSKQDPKSVPLASVDDDDDSLPPSTIAKPNPPAEGAILEVREEVVAEEMVEVKTEVIPAAGYTEENVVSNDANPGSKAVTVDRDAAADCDAEAPGMALDASAGRTVKSPPAEVESVDVAVKSKGEGSVGTQDTRDDPLDHNGTPKEKVSKLKAARPAAYHAAGDGDEEGGRAMPSDEEKLGWVSGDAKNTTESADLQIGDYISVDCGDGKPRRKAFVEAYLPKMDLHFIAFCDSVGGNMKIRLTESNHTVCKEEEVDAITRAKVLDDAAGGDEGSSGAAPRRTLNKRKRNSVSLTLADKAKKRKDTKVAPPPIQGAAAGAEICGRCIKTVWPGSELIYVALVLGYHSKTKKHNVVYMSDHCVETMDLTLREWWLMKREDEPWRADGMIGKRLYVFCNAEYDDPEAQARAVAVFGEDTKVPYEAYVLSVEDKDKYKILYPATEDTEVRSLNVEEDEVELKPTEKEWDILEEGQMDVSGLPVLMWSE